MNKYIETHFCSSSCQSINQSINHSPSSFLFSLFACGSSCGFNSCSWHILVFFSAVESLVPHSFGDSSDRLVIIGSRVLSWALGRATSSLVSVVALIFAFGAVSHKLFELLEFALIADFWVIGPALKVVFVAKIVVVFITNGPPAFAELVFAQSSFIRVA